MVTDHRSSFVRRVATPRGDVFAKTYVYATWGERLRCAWRWTAPFRQSRASREFDALHWMHRHGLPAPVPIAVLESRRAGFLATATLLTARFDGAPTCTLFPVLPPAERQRLAAAIGRLVAQLHDLGFRDGNLDLRNLLAQRTGDEFVVAKIDSPRHRLVPPGRRTDRHTTADWRRLMPQLDAFGVGNSATVAAQSAAVTPPPANASRRS